MINVNELRIGNWVITRCGIEATKKYSPFGRIVMLSDNSAMASNDSLPGNLCNIFSQKYDIDELSPITLTEKILLKCGFRIDNSHEGYKGYYIDYDEYNRFNLGFYGKQRKVAECHLLHRTCEGKEYALITPTSLHQLQNLYFALIGEELNVELKIEL